MAQQRERRPSKSGQLKRFGAAVAILVVVAGIGFVAAMPGLIRDLVTEQVAGHSPAAQCVTPDGTDVEIPAGEFEMGSDAFYPEEGPRTRVQVATFRIDQFAVTNRQFAAFVTATGYVTDAERKPDPADYPEIPPEQMVSGGAVFMPLNGRPSPAEVMEWWRFVPGANWCHPDGPESTIAGKADEPVVQVSFKDASAYAAWAGRELPTEAQMEFGARGGLAGKTYAWGDERKPGGAAQANTWEGPFPVDDSAADGCRAPIAGKRIQRDASGIQDREECGAAGGGTEVIRRGKRKMRVSTFIGAALALLLITSAPHVRSAEVAPPAENRTLAASLILLGSGGGPVLRVTRSQPASLLVVNGAVYLIDAGDGVTAKVLASGFTPSQVKAVFLTHQHMDHSGGLGAFVAFNWSVVRQTPLPGFGPPGTAALVQRGLSYFGVSEETFARQTPPPRKMADIPAPKEVTGDGQFVEDENIRRRCRKLALFQRPPGEALRGLTFVFVPL